MRNVIATLLGLSLVASPMQVGPPPNSGTSVSAINTALGSNAGGCTFDSAGLEACPIGVNTAARGVFSSASTSTATLLATGTGGLSSNGPSVLDVELTGTSTAYQYGITCFDPGMTAGTHILCPFFGQANTTNNAVLQGFRYVGSGSSANSWGIGWAGYGTFIFGVQAGGAVSVGNAESNSALPGLFNVGASNQFQVSPAGVVIAPGIGTGTASNTDFAGELTLSAGSATYTFTRTYSSHPICTANDETANATVKPSYTGTTTVTFTGTGSDVIGYTCVGRN